MNMLKKLFTALVFIFLFSQITVAQNYTPVDSASKIHFVIKNFGINTGGDFHNLKGNIVFLPESLSTAKFNVTVDASTIDTDNEMRDKNLTSDEYFDVTKFPRIKIVSTKIEKTNKTDAGYYFFTGTLTIKGITKPISFPFQAVKTSNGFLFTGNFQIDRAEFGVGEKNMVLSNNVNVSLSVLANKQ
jgi:polyisoprenoid-binding protein YceI